MFDTEWSTKNDVARTITAQIDQILSQRPVRQSKTFARETGSDARHSSGGATTAAAGLIEAIVASYACRVRLGQPDEARDHRRGPAAATPATATKAMCTSLP
jgi:hypothetical protein